MDGAVGSSLMKLELSPVEKWRYNVFVEAGFEAHRAELLAVSPAVVHDILKALENGCSIDLAFEIFF